VHGKSVGPYGFSVGPNAQVIGLSVGPKRRPIFEEDHINTGKINGRAPLSFYFSQPILLPFIMDKENIAQSTGAASDTLRDETSIHESIKIVPTHQEELEKVNSYRPSILSVQDIEGAKKNLSVLTIYAGLSVAMFMASLNSTVIAPALGKISSELNDVEDATWIATAYLVAFNATQPLYGKVSFLN
jgi:hypothetical protein